MRNIPILSIHVRKLMLLKMTQEFVAETIGVSRQAVSKWENGTSEPNTSNLMALARLYGIPAEDLLKGVESALEAQEKES